MNVIAKISAAILLLFSFSACQAQIKNAITEHVKIYGNCDMCKKTIEAAGNVTKVAMVEWDQDTKLATITYDSTKTNQDEILKRIALVGYDSDHFLAPDDVYNKLDGCCQYERVNKTAMTTISVIEDHPKHPQETVMETKQEVNQLKAIFGGYFELKDALVKSDGKSASTIARDFLAHIDGVKMDKLSQEEHIVWMKVLSSLKANTDKIAATTNVETQRIYFMELSAAMYDLRKASRQETIIYYQNCPMYNEGKGANWLSKENAVKNPYYGAQMLSCGKTIETIKQ